MISAFNIVSIAFYEMKNLTRSWFFRIFSILSLGIIVLINIGLFGTERSPMMLKALPSLIPYLNILLLNVVQAIIGGFMASDFMKYDRKLDTTSVIYMRSMTNADYVFGKTLGVLSVFAVLNILTLIISFVFNSLISDNPIIWKLYLLYPALISLPTLIFIFGLSFLLMAILGSQALTFVILLGYIATTIFFLGNRFHYIFDYMAFNVPLVYSDFSGFTDLKSVLIHRGIYLSFGTSFVFSTVLIIKRLPQSKIVNAFSAFMAITGIVTALGLAGIYLDNLFEANTARDEMRTLNTEYSTLPEMSITEYDIDLAHKNDTIEVNATLAYENNSGKKADTLVFSLNPRLIVNSVSAGGSKCEFEQKHHILTVKPPQAVGAGDYGNITIEYAGSIDENACYLDISNEMRELSFKVLLYNLGKRYAFIGPNYVLLSPETLWYPVAGIPVGGIYPEIRQKGFADYHLSVSTRNGLTAISQGNTNDNGDGTFSFEPETPLPSISLAIGNYEKKSIIVEDIEFAVYVLEGHDFFSETFTDLKDALPELISTPLTQMEDRLGAYYSYDRMLFIETPIQYYTYPRLWTTAQECTQPEQIWFPEKAMLVQSADFSRSMHWIRHRIERGDMSDTPEEIQSQIFNGFISQTFINPNMSFSRLRRGVSVRSGRGLSMPRLFIGGIPEYYASFSLFPLFFTYNYQFTSDNWPIFPSLVESFMVERNEQNVPSFFRMITGTSDEERANIAMSSNSIEEILTEPEDRELAQNVLKQKSVTLFAGLQSSMGSEEFNKFFDDVLYDKIFKSTKASDLIYEISEKFESDLEPVFETLIAEERLPAFNISDPKAYEVIEDEKTRYQILFTVTNPEPVDGVISVSFRSGGGPGGRRGGGMFRQTEEETPNYYTIHSGETKEIGVILDDRPNGVNINTLVSLNLPAVIEKRFGDIPEEDEIELFDGERVIEELPVSSEYEIIIDNEDPGFEMQSISTASFVRKWVEERYLTEDEYVGLSFWNLPRRWKLTTNTGFFGDYRLSARYIRAGEGLNRASWTAEIPESGRYSVYCYASEIQMPMRRGRGGRRSPAQDFHFTVRHDDGADDIEVDMDVSASDWIHLGSWFFTEGKATVELSDESNGRLVYADAVKWVKEK